jgi:hypothetical protein
MDGLAGLLQLRSRAAFPAACEGCGTRTRTLYVVQGYAGTYSECTCCFAGRTDPDAVALVCPHCGQGDVSVGAGGMLWVHTCGAYGYYDDGAEQFPAALYRVRGSMGLYRAGGPAVAP